MKRTVLECKLLPDCRIYPALQSCNLQAVSRVLMAGQKKTVYVDQTCEIPLCNVVCMGATSSIKTSRSSYDAVLLLARQLFGGKSSLAWKVNTTTKLATSKSSKGI